MKFSLVSIYSQTYEHSNVKGGGGRGGGRGTGKEHDKDKSKKSGNNRGNNSFQGKRFPGERGIRSPPRLPRTISILPLVLTLFFKAIDKGLELRFLCTMTAVYKDQDIQYNGEVKTDPLNGMSLFLI